MDSASKPKAKVFQRENGSSESPHISPSEIEGVLAELGRSLSLVHLTPAPPSVPKTEEAQENNSEDTLPTIAERYRVLVEQIPAVVFMAYLDGSITEAYVSPHIEQMLGFSREEWLDDPIRWYQQIHPEDRDRWSVEAAEMFLKGTPLKSVYRVLARDGREVWFHCEAKLVRRNDGDHGLSMAWGSMSPI
jgi:PAS domain S-box-containing protein